MTIYGRHDVSGKLPDVAQTPSVDNLLGDANDLLVGPGGLCHGSTI